jgi:hypothetical protein
MAKYRIPTTLQASAAGYHYITKPVFRLNQRIRNNVASSLQIRMYSVTHHPRQTDSRLKHRYHLLGHTLFISVYVAYTVYCAAFYRPFIPDFAANLALWGWFLIFNVGLAYLNIYYLMPKMLYRHRYVAYGACFVGCLALMTLSVAFSAFLLDTLYHSGQFLSALQSPRLIIPLTFACPMAVVLYNRQLTDRKRIHQLENVTMQLELEQLKKQINPHFLFNMLNNAMVLLKTDSREASQALLRLKDLLNYQLTVSSADETLLTNDIHFLNDFLNLEKIRRDRFEFDIAVEGDTNGIYVPPFLFIPFVENAVKHNPACDDYLPYVHIRFRPDNGKLHFTCINSRPYLQQSTESKGGGLGLVHVKRRLLLLYPQNHLLNIANLTDCFQVDLQIPYPI